MVLLTPSKTQWNAFVAANAADGGLLQSWAWGELEQTEGHAIHRLAWGNGEIEACALLIERKLPFGWKYLYCPRGPVLKISDLPRQQAGCRFQIADLIRELVTFAKQHRAVFLRVEPVSNFDPPAGGRVSDLKSVQPVQPDKTIRINLTQSDDELLSQMHQKTRYNIRLAEKNNVTVHIGTIDAFWKLLQTTTDRDAFRGHTKQHYELLLQHLDAKLFIAEHDGQPLAAAIVAFFGSTAYYLHGASANEKRNLMAPYLLHWRIMQEAKQRGCAVYDLWGVDETRWPGVTRFKLGFAPHAPLTTYAGTYDLLIRKIPYALYHLKKML